MPDTFETLLYYFTVIFISLMYVFIETQRCSSTCQIHTEVGGVEMGNLAVWLLLPMLPIDKMFI